MLFVDEFRLKWPVRSASDYAAQFAERGPRDSRGRSLRELDLNSRLFKYPCSYLIYSDSFDSLPAVVKQQVYGRLSDILSGKEQDETFAHLSAADREAIREILMDTKPDFTTGLRQR